MKKRITRSWRKSSGFSLIELMVTVAIVAIVASIAYPSYTSQVRKSRRTEAKTALLDLAGREEKLYSTSNAYSNLLSDLGYTGAGSTTTVGSGYYSVTVSNVTAGPPATFQIRATPIGAQASDADCTSFTVDQTGAQTSTGTSATCW
jgi:type IV pilus assembly protein PilE